MKKYQSFLLVITLLISPIVIGIMSPIMPHQTSISINDFDISANSEAVTNFSVATGLDILWGLGLDGTGITVAILDSGIDSSHVDLDDLDDNIGTTDPKVILEQSYVVLPISETGDLRDLNGHGTHVAGIVSGTGGGSSGEFQGVAPQTQLINVKIINYVGDGYDTWVTSGLQYAVDNGADIIVLSVGAITNDPVNSMNQAVINAWNDGVVVVCAGGNDGTQGHYSINSPADALDVIAVGGVNVYDDLASFSSWGPNAHGVPKPDIVAPAVEIVSTVSSDSPLMSSPSVIDEGGNYYIPMSGTSMAAPFVAGGIALLLDAFSVNPDTIKASLLASADDLGLNPYKQGAGRVNFAEAYNLLNDPSWVPFAMTPIRMVETPFEYDPMNDLLVPILLVAGETITDPYFEVSGAIGQYIRVPTLSTFSGQIVVNMKFTSELTISAGTYSGTISFKNGAGTTIGSFDVLLRSEGFFIGLIIVIIIVLIGIIALGLLFVLRIATDGGKDVLCENFGILCPNDQKK